MTVNRMAAGATVCCAVLFVSACGGGGSTTGAVSAPTTATSGGGAGSGAGSGTRGFPGATGLLAQVDGTTMQVQGANTQTAVTYSKATTFTETVPAGLSGVVVGVCVQARSARTPSGAGGATTPTAPSADEGPIAAASVEISQAVNGGCSALGGLRTPGARPPGANGDTARPSGAPTSGRTRGQGGAGTGFGGTGFGGLGAFGKVTAVSGASFTVDSSRPQNSTAARNVPTTRTVKTSPTTIYTQTRAANAKALAVGLCVTALGKGDDTGSIAATSIALRPAENGSCSSGFGRRGPGGNPSTAGGGSGA